MNQSSKTNEWLAEKNVSSIEVIVPDMAGMPRGKIRATSQIEAKEIKLPIAVFAQTVAGTYVKRKDNVEDKDMYLQPDLSTIRLIPWASDPMASVIADCRDIDGESVNVAPRAVLAGVVENFRSRGWHPVVAPEVEFYLTNAQQDQAIETEMKEPSEAPLSGSTDPYGVEGLHDLGGFFQQLCEGCRTQQIALEGVSQELGPGQFEANFRQGPAVKLADDVIHFKRTVRRVATAHGMRATFLAKPTSEGAGNSLHIHQSVYDESDENVFSRKSGQPSRLFEHYIGGLQRYMSDSLLLFAPYANSYRRLLNHYSSPINLEWGVDNRTVGLRVPRSVASARRIENRLAGSDVNPYLAIAGTLACGYLGMTQKLSPRPPVEGSAYQIPFALHRHLYEALDALRESSTLRDVLGDGFVTLYTEVKDLEYYEFQKHVTEWEREELMFSV